MVDVPTPPFGERSWPQPTSASARGKQTSGEEKTLGENEDASDKNNTFKLSSFFAKQIGCSTEAC